MYLLNQPKILFKDFAALCLFVVKADCKRPISISLIPSYTPKTPEKFVKLIMSFPYLAYPLRIHKKIIGIFATSVVLTTLYNNLSLLKRHVSLITQIILPEFPFRSACSCLLLTFERKALSWLTISSEHESETNAFSKASTLVISM